VEIRVALDTNRLIDFFRGDEALTRRLEACDEIWIRLLVLGEIKAGFYGGTEQRRNETFTQ
jgi:predicted nucleic acid-binding protein